MANVTVDFANVVQVTDPHTLGVGSSTYGANPLSSDAQREAEQRLDARFIRVPVGWRNGRVTTSAAGTNGTLDMPALVNLYRSWGYRVIAVCGGRTNDRDIQGGDARRIAEALGFDDIDYTPPNEPDNMGNWTVDNVNDGRYSVTRTAMMVHDELRQLNPNVKIWGPVWVDERRGETQRYIDIMGNRLAGVDFHRYGAGMGAGPNQKSTETYFNETRDRFGGMIANCRADLRARGLDAPYGNVNLDEMNFRWIYENDPRFFQAINTVWMTSALGHVLLNGGKAMPYATQNGALGVMVEQWNNDQGRTPSSPMPAYWAISAFTGSKIWPHYKDAFYRVDSDDPNVEVFAVNNEAGGYNLVVVNKKEWNDSTLNLSLRNISNGGYSVYQSVKDAPYDQPRLIVEDAGHSGSISLRLPACTISIIVINGDANVTPPEPVEPSSNWTINVGSTAEADGWIAGGTLVTGGTIASNQGSTGPVEGVQGAVFDTERWGEQVWRIPVPNGPHKVVLMFSERFTGAQQPGGRLFNVSVNGQTREDLDVWVEQGEIAVGSLLLPFDVDVTDETVVIELSVGSTGDNPFLNAIEILPVQPVQPPTPEVDLTPVWAAVAVAKNAQAEADAATSVASDRLADLEAAVAALKEAQQGAADKQASATAALEGIEAALIAVDPPEGKARH